MVDDITRTAGGGLSMICDLPPLAADAKMALVGAIRIRIHVETQFQQHAGPADGTGRP